MLAPALVAGLCFVLVAVLLHAEQRFLALVAGLIGLAVIWPIVVQYLRIPL